MKQVWAKDLRDEMNVALTFSYEFQATPDTVLRLASNVPFRLKIDGNLYSYGPRRKAHGHAAINTYDLSAYAGKEIAIDVECVSYRVENFYIVNQTPFFAVEILQNGKVIADSFDFKAYKNASKLQKVQRFSYQRGFVEAYKIDKTPTLISVETNEETVCELSESCVPYPRFEEIVAEEFENGNIFEKEDFEEYNDDYLNRRGSKFYPREEQEYRITLENDKYGFEKTNQVGDVLSKTYKAYRLPRNVVGFLAFDVEVYEDANIMINYDEKISPLRYSYEEKFRSNPDTENNMWVDRSATFKAGACNIDVYRLHSLSLMNYKLTKGKYSLTAFEPDQMQCIRFFVIEGSAKISNVHFITYENQDVKLEFSCEDEELNLIFNSAINTFKPNSVDVLTDCASRERAGWLCDTYFSGRAEKLLTGNSFVEKNTIEAFRDYRSKYCPNIPKEVFPMCYPSDHVFDRYIPNWCMWFILELGEYLERTGDRKLVDELKQKMVDFVEYELAFMNSDGLLEDVPGWVFVEWSRANDLINGVNYPTNMLFAGVLKAMYKMYGETRYKTLAEKMDEEIVKQSYNGKFFVDNATRDENGKLVRNTEWTEVCQYYAFWCGYADKERYPDLFNAVYNEIYHSVDLKEKYPEMSPASAFIGLYLRLDYLSRIRESEMVIRDLKKFFMPQAIETKTFWEYRTAVGSCCHAFASLMCEWILRSVIGFEKVDESGVVLQENGIKMHATAKIPYNGKIFSVTV